MKLAIDSNDVAGVRALLKAGADPNGFVYSDDKRGIWERFQDSVRGGTRREIPAGSGVLTYAAYRVVPQWRGGPSVDNSEVVEALLTAGAKVEGPLRSEDMAPIFAAAAFDKPKTMRALLEHGADPNTSINDAFGDGDTPLFSAASGGMLDIVKLLIQHGANPNARTSRGLTPLVVDLEGVASYDYQADKQKAYEVAKYLFRHGAKPNGKTQEGLSLYALGRRNADTRHDYQLLHLLRDYDSGKLAPETNPTPLRVTHRSPNVNTR